MCTVFIEEAKHASFPFCAYGVDLIISLCCEQSSAHICDVVLNHRFLLFAKHLFTDKGNISKLTVCCVFCITVIPFEVRM